MSGHIIKFTVVGKVPFPIDMLRYDAAWPAQTRDADQIAESIAERDLAGMKFEVNLLKWADNRNASPTIARWESFMWAVKEVEHY